VTVEFAVDPGSGLWRG